jgi:hypothetical protein
LKFTNQKQQKASSFITVTFIKTTKAEGTQFEFAANRR